MNMDAMDGNVAAFAPQPRHVVSPLGGTELHYDLCCYTSPLGVKIQCAVISPVDNRFLLAFPHQVWHRQVARRVLPQQLLGKPTLVEVACSPEEDREVVDDAGTMMNYEAMGWLCHCRGLRRAGGRRPREGHGLLHASL